MPATTTTAQLSFLEHAYRSVERNQAPAPDPSQLDMDKTGVVFVHGIGSQMPGETLLQWSAPIIDALTAIRMNFGDSALPVDPVIRSEVNFGDGLSAIEVRVPPKPGSSHHRHWVMTEAWWASTVTPPSLGTMTAWLGPQGASGRIVAGILGNPEGRGPFTSGVIIKAASILLVPFVSVLAALVLTGFALFRGVSGLIPIAAVRDSAILKSFDTFLTGWFGDVRILLYDPAQSANIRGGLARAIRALRAQGCGRMVVVAHSGGAIVSYLTLTDPALPDIQVDKLITFGEAWNLALRLSPRGPQDGSGMADRLRADITLAQPDLRWRDFWATNDPAPDGNLMLEEIGKLEANLPAEEERAIRVARPNAIRTAKVWNRRSLLDDHGTYWTNDEEFVIPVMREIDVAEGWGEASGFYPPDPDPSAPVVADAPPTPWRAPGGLEPGPRATRHRQRIAALAMWRQTSIVIPVAVVAAALALFPQRLIEIGTEANRLIGMIPGVSHLNGIIGWLQQFQERTFPVLIEVGAIKMDFDLLDFMAYWGIGVLQAVVIISIIQLASAWIRGFTAWPDRSPTYYVALMLEVTLFAVLLAGLYFIIMGADHDLLLGGGAGDWFRGFLVTFLVGALAGGGSLLVKAINSPAATRAFGIGGAVVFIAALACAFVAIFRTPRLPDAETAYVVIWATFVILYRIGKSRWHHWDRLERQIAAERQGLRDVPRWPAYLTSLAVLLAATAAAIAILDWENRRTLVTVLVLLGVAAAAAGYVIGGIAARNRRDLNAAPDSVESGFRY